MTHLLLDISRLLSRAGRPAMTGIDRVELAYFERLAALPKGAVSFTARGPLGEITLLPRGLALTYVRRLAARWRGEPAERGLTPQQLSRLIWTHLVIHREWELHLSLRMRRRRPATWVHVSHKDLDRPASIRRLQRWSGVRFVPLVHDLIPLEWPQFAGEGQDARHAERMTTVARLADAVIVNSGPTGAALQRFCEGVGRIPPITVAPLGIEATPVKDPLPPSDPYFVVLATIEPKKNHRLLLDVWSRLAAAGDAPRLVLIGQRGWKTDEIAEALAQAPAGLVEEHNALPDATVRGLLGGARALLAPSLAEGFGLPVGEALALGVPVICSDIPAHRFVGGDAPDYLAAQDAGAWIAAVRDYAQPDSQRRRAQQGRIVHWETPSWDDHFDLVMPVLSRR